MQGGAGSKKNDTKKEGETQDMKEITVMKRDLLAKLVQNRDDHLDKYKKAMKIYAERQKTILEKLLEDLQDGKPVDTWELTKLPTPENHTDDYNRAIAMLTMHVGDEATVSTEEYRTYVEDNWSWSQRAGHANDFYVSG